MECELRHQDWVQEQEQSWAKPPEDVITPGIKVICQAADPREVARFVPLRLTECERIVWNILNQSLEVSEYTDKVDVYCSGSKQRRMATEINQLCAIVSGLVVAHTYDRGQKCVARDFKGNEQMYQRIFELGRRIKILNPTQMRSTYGKLMWMLMDSCKSETQELLGFNLICDIQTVESLLADKDHGEKLLADPLFIDATIEVAPEGRSRSEIQEAIKRKEDALKTLKKQYGEAPAEKMQNVNELIKSFENGLPEPRRLLTAEEVELCVKSVADYNAFQRGCVYPVERMISLLDEYFDPEAPEPPHSLEIRHGVGGSCLSHSHSTHYRFVRQSLMLWREVMSRMFTLWHCTEQDLLQARYRLADTGQGLNRVQSAPSVSKVMHSILHQVQSDCDHWVGLSVVHLGDRDVPNALFFIDKYTQVPRILAPIAQCIDRIPILETKSPALANFIDGLGGSHKLIQSILLDFFRHGFDGSGDDGGSCVDGRLTSCWNWCSKIEKKKYFPAFLLTGFTGFDG
eukprot:GEMP01013001.1.p1 GENE.GEMP01013001.1~~GEMP01013001.1.p1  ORF type:complete len:586 (+),score=83.39 GEMP01013001.1:211-1758(+)